MAILGNFGPAPLFKKTGDFEILAKSLTESERWPPQYIQQDERHAHELLDIQVHDTTNKGNFTVPSELKGQKNKNKKGDYSALFLRLGNL